MASGMEKNTGNTGTPREKMRGIRILAAALAIGVILFSLVIISMVEFTGQTPNQRITEFSSYLLPILGGITVLAVLMAHTGYSKAIKKIRESSDPLTIKLDGYRVALTKYLAICEGMAMFGIVAFFITSQYTLLIISALMLGLMLAKLVTLKNPETELNLSWQEQEELKK
jgi:hypothetical protein